MAILDDARRAIGLETEQERKDKAAGEEVQEMYRYYKDAKRKKEYEWFVNDNFYNNNHYLRFNPALQQLQPIPLKELADKVTVNFVGQVVRGITSFLNKEHPIVSVSPGKQSDESYEKSKKEKHLVDYWYDHLGLNKVIKEVTMDACKYGIGWFKVAWDSDALSPTTPYKMQNGESSTTTYGDICVNRVDPFDVYPDPIGTSENMRGIIHAFTRTVGELKHNSRFRNTDKIMPDGKLAPSAIKQQQMQTQNANMQTYNAGPDDHKTCVVLEAYVRKFDEENGWHIRQVTATETGILLADELWPFDKFPFIPYQTDITSNILGSIGVIRNIREINRALNQQISQVLKSSRIMGHLNWKAPRGANINIITDDDGQIIEFDPTPGGGPEQAQPATLPPYIMELISRFETYIQSISGLHDATLGKAPFSRASGELVNNLQEGDSNNLAMYRDNLDDSLNRLFKLAFMTAKKNYTTKRKFKVSGDDGIDQNRWIEIDAGDISLDDDIKVISGTDVPYSLADKRDMATNLFKEGIVTDPKVILKLMELPDVDNVMGDDQLDVDRQLDENKQLMKGTDPGKPVIAEDHSTHIRVLDNLIKNPVFKEIKPDAQQAILNHRSQHIDFSIQLAQIAASMQFEPIKRSEMFNIRMNSLSELTPIERTQTVSKYGIQSDAAQIQQRGGLFVQDPEQARQQAMVEDNEMLIDINDPSEMSQYMAVGPGDNHAVHLEVHGEAMSQPAFKNQPQQVQDYFKTHYQQHLSMLKGQASAPGLINNEYSSLPNHAGLAKTPGPNAPLKPMPQTPVRTMPTAAHHELIDNLQTELQKEKAKNQNGANTQKKRAKPKS